MRDRLRAFEDLGLGEEAFEEAASCFNRCRARGVQGSNTDFLICAVALLNDLSIFSADRDFEGYAKVLGLHLHAPR